MRSPLAVSPLQTPESTAARVAPSPGIVTPTCKPNTKMASVVKPAMPVEEPKTNVVSETQTAARYRNLRTHINCTLYYLCGRFFLLGQSTATPCRLGVHNETVFGKRRTRFLAAQTTQRVLKQSTPSSPIPSPACLVRPPTLPRPVLHLLLQSSHRPPSQRRQKCRASSELQRRPSSRRNIR